MPTTLEVHTTVAKREDAQLIARKLVSERLAACVQLVSGITSIYNWEGKIHEDEEVMLLIKTTSEVWPALRDRLEQLHPYDTPEVLAMEVRHGSFAYLNWVRECTTSL